MGGRGFSFHPAPHMKGATVPVWLQLTKPKRISAGGQSIDRWPGDWVQVGKQTAQAWIAEGSAVVPYPQAMQAEEPAGTAGVMVFWGSASYEEVKVEWANPGKYELRWEKTCFWDTRAATPRHLLGAGFSFLNKWQVAAPLWDYRELAMNEGTDEERERTKSIIRDLRVPMYDTRLVFMRRCPETRTLLEIWDGESNGKMDRLSFLRALYRVKPLTLALPVTWTGQWAPTTA